MASSLPSPPATPAPTNPMAEPPMTELSTRLDALLISYLELLDTYTELRASLSKEFSSGFFSLAQANRSSNLGPGRRYGEEGYDERMKAIRTLKIGKNSTEKTKKESKNSTKNSEAAETKLESPSEESNEEASKADSNNPPSERIESYSFSIETVESSESSPAPRNPLTWYGILTPPALRQTQTHFTSAMTTTIPRLVETIDSMKTLEQRIWELRKQVGILNEYKAEDEEAEGEDEDEVNEQDEQDAEPQSKSRAAGFSASKTPSSAAAAATTTSSSSTSLPRRKQDNVSTKSTELRSRVLKVD